MYLVTLCSRSVPANGGETLRGSKTVIAAAVKQMRRWSQTRRRCGKSLKILATTAPTYTYVQFVWPALWSLRAVFRKCFWYGCVRLRGL